MKIKLNRYKTNLIYEILFGEIWLQIKLNMHQVHSTLTRAITEIMGNKKQVILTNSFKF